MPPAIFCSLRRAEDPDDAPAGRRIIASLSRRLEQRGVQQVTVLSTPEGATVTLDAEFVGVTPWTTELAPGVHEVTWYPVGHANVTRSFELPAYEAIDVSVALDRSDTVSDPSKGAIEFFVTSDLPRSDAASVALAQENDAFHPVTDFDSQPVYLDGEGEAVLGATAGAHGAFVNLPAALYVLTFGHLGAGCASKSPLYGYPLDSQLPGLVSIVVPVIEGHVTTPVGVSCAQATAAGK